jgi:hypothetical protein
VESAGELGRTVRKVNKTASSRRVATMRVLDRRSQYTMLRTDNTVRFYPISRTKVIT